MSIQISRTPESKGLSSPFFLLSDAFGALCVVVPCGGVVEEGGDPLLGELHGGADSRVEEVPDRGGAPVRERWTGSTRLPLMT